MGRTAYMGMLLEIETGDKDPTVEDWYNRQPVRAVLLCKVRD
jgi:hypothetical protein